VDEVLMKPSKLPNPARSHSGPPLWRDPLIWLPVVTAAAAAVMFGMAWREVGQVPLPAPTPSVSVTVSASSPAAVSLLEQMEAAMNQLKTLKAVEVMTDDSGHTLTTTMEYAAPDQIRLVTDTGAQYIGIGRQQWARSQGKILWSTWERLEPIRFPDFHDSQTAVDVQLSAETQLEGRAVRVVTFALLDSRSRFDYKVYADSRTLLFHRVTMDGPGHHMVIDYVNHAPTIVIATPPPVLIAPTPTVIIP
jgi:hypothetical protein